MYQRIAATTLVVLSLVALGTSCTKDSSSASTTTARQPTPSTSPSTSAPESAVTVTGSGPITLKVGERATIRLQANKTTGYEWDLTAPPDAAVVTVVSDTYIAPDTPLVGAGGTQEFVVEGIAAGSTTVALGLARPWEEGTPPVETATFDVTVS